MSRKTPTRTHLLKYLKEIRTEAVDSTLHSRRESKQVFDYLAGDQLPYSVKRVLAKRGQPESWENIIREIDNALDGVKRMSRTEIEVTARHKDDTDRASLLSKIHHSTIDSTEWNHTKDQADRDLRVAGLCVIESALRMTKESDRMGRRIMEIERTHMPVLECMIDMNSRKPDYSDASYFHHERYYDKEILEGLYGKSRIGPLDANQDRQIRLTRTWYRHRGKIRIATWHDTGVLEDIAQPYQRTHGRFSVTVRRFNWGREEYYGLYRDVIPFQDSMNHQKLRMKNMMGSYKMLIEATAVEDVDHFSSEFGIDNSVTVVKDGALRDKRFHEISLQSNISQMMAVIQDDRRRAMQIVGVNPELLGSSTVRQSGVALEIKQNAALTGMQRYLGASNAADVDVFEIDTAIMEEYYTAEQVLHIVGEDGIRIPFYLNRYLRDEEGRVIYRDGLPLQESLLSVGRYDFVINQVPFSNGSSDAKMKNWAEVSKIIDPSLAQELIPVMLDDVGSEQSKRAKAVIDKHRDSAQTEDPAAQMQMQQMQLVLEEMASKIAEMQSRANLNNAKAQGLVAEMTPIVAAETAAQTNQDHQDNQ